MHIKSILAVAAIALAAAVGSASAADQFTTLDGIAADVMTPREMGVVIGAATIEVDITAVFGGPAVAGGLATAPGALTLIGVKTLGGLADPAAVGAQPNFGGSPVTFD